MNFICVHDSLRLSTCGWPEPVRQHLHTRSFRELWQIGSIFVHHSRPVFNILFSKAGGGVFEIVYKHQFDSDEVVHNLLFGCVDKPFGTLPNLIDVSVSFFGEADCIYHWCHPC